MVIYSPLQRRLLTFLIVVCELQLFILIANAQAPEAMYNYCPNTTTYNPNSTYQANLNKLLANLSSTNTLFFNATEGNVAPDAVYGLVLCRGDLTIDACRECAGAATKEVIKRCPKEKESVIWYDECMLRYNNISFFGKMQDSFPGLFMWNLNNISDTDRFNRILGDTINNDSGGNGGLSTGVIIGIAVAVIISIVLCIVVFCILRRMAKKQQNDILNAIEGVDANAISAPESLQFDLNNVKAATDNFSVANKIGHDGFGEVFQGLLNGQQIMVKRLSKSSRQGVQEFKNEVLIVPKLQHRNLVRLLGYCLDEGEKILIYEFLPNKSLDFILFDDEMKQSLHWSRRYNIIGGVARGMLYLHEDQRLRIIHRDLNASNVLLDSDMNAKITGFGMARVVSADESQMITSRVVGTSGYMAPEYALHGQFSIKSDVFSFGVLVLQIISGTKNFRFHQSGNSEDLTSYAWKLWRDNRPLDLVDPSLGDNYAQNEVIRCIHIGLLCVQEEAEDRPTMAAVVHMLSSYDVTLPSPHEPAFFLGSRTTAIPDHPDSS